MIPAMVDRSHHDEHQHDVNGTLLAEHGLVLLNE